MIKYSRDLHPHEQLVKTLNFVERTLHLLCKGTYTHKSGLFEETTFNSIRYKAFAICFLKPTGSGCIRHFQIMGTRKYCFN